MFKKKNQEAEKPTKKTTKKVAKTTEVETKNLPKDSKVFGTLGIGLGFVFVSIAYCIYMILMGTTGLFPKIMIAPAVVFELVCLGYAFWKIFK